MAATMSSRLRLMAMSRSLPHRRSRRLYGRPGFQRPGSPDRASPTTGRGTRLTLGDGADVQRGRGASLCPGQDAWGERLRRRALAQRDRQAPRPPPPGSRWRWPWATTPSGRWACPAARRQERLHRGHGGIHVTRGDDRAGGAEAEEVARAVDLVRHERRADGSGLDQQLRHALGPAEEHHHVGRGHDVAGVGHRAQQRDVGGQAGVRERAPEGLVEGPTAGDDHEGPGAGAPQPAEEVLAVLHAPLRTSRLPT